MKKSFFFLLPDHILLSFPFLRGLREFFVSGEEAAAEVRGGIKGPHVQRPDLLPDSHALVCVLHVSILSPGKGGVGSITQAPTRKLSGTLSCPDTLATTLFFLGSNCAQMSTTQGGCNDVRNIEQQRQHFSMSLYM